MNFPFFNRSTRDYLGTDIYEETQSVTDGRDDYEGFQEELRPKTYREKNRPIYMLTAFFKIAFPYLSGGTLLGLVIFLAFDVEAVLENRLNLTGWIVGIVSLMGCIFLVAINETVKTRSLSEAFYAMVKKITIPGGVKSRAIITTIVSIVGSAIGLYLITYQISDNSGEIKTRAQNIQATAAKTWSDDSLRIVNSFSANISEKEKTMQNFDPAKFRTKRNSINDEIIQLTQEREDRIKEAKAERQAATQNALTQMETELTTNDQDASGRGWIALAVIVILEALNIYCHFFTWTYKAKSVKEGIEFGAIESSSEKTTFEIQMQRLGAFLQNQGYAFHPQINQQQGQIGIPGPTQIGQIGFKQTPKNDPDPLKTGGEINPAILEKILTELKGLKDQIPQGFLSSSGAQTTSTETIKKEVVLDKSHPRFTKTVQPDEYRGIDQTKYKVFTIEAKKVLKEVGKYNKALIAQRTGLARNSVTLYLKVAFERNDLQP